MRLSPAMDGAIGPRCRVRTLACLCAAAGLVLFAAGGEIHGSVGAASEYEVKAAFIFNFVKFTTWPDDPDRSGPMRLCIAGHDPFGPLMESTIGGKTVRGRGFSIERYDLSDDLTACEILFIGDGDTAERKALLDSLEGRPILTVGESAAFARGGGMVGFYEKQRRIRFSVNVDATERSDIRVSSKLLQLASVVREKQ